MASKRSGVPHPTIRGNLVSSWKAWAKKRYGTLKKAYSAIETSLGGMAASGNISRWERGVRRMPPAAVNYMLDDVLPVLLAESTDSKFIIERIQLPVSADESTR